MQACDFCQWIDLNSISVSEARIEGSESKEMYLGILEEMRWRRAVKRRAKEMNIRIKEMHCQMREDELKEEEEELQIREEAIKKREQELKSREDQLHKTSRRNSNIFPRSTQ